MVWKVRGGEAGSIPLTVPKGHQIIGVGVGKDLAIFAQILEATPT
jgi:hypothetical protein